MTPTRWPRPGLLFSVLLLSSLVYSCLVFAAPPFPVTGSGTANLWRHFGILCTLPRLSGQEEAVRQYIREVAARHGLDYRQDRVGNLQVFVPATSGRERLPETILHAHMDMVGDKVPESTHDFSRDPVVCVRNGDWLSASGTTLGADNGVGLAAILALLDEPGRVHGPLRLLFTVDEEGGFTGADGIDPAFLAAPRLINLDSEEAHEFNIGCAGGVTHRTEIPTVFTPASPGDAPLYLRVSGLTGGHSGVEIHHGRANAIRLLAQLLLDLQRTTALQIEALRAGTYDTTIPREAEAVVRVPRERVIGLTARLRSLAARLREDFAATDPEMRLIVETAAASRTTGLVWRGSTTEALPAFLLSLPWGVQVMSREFPDQVETSVNPGVLTLETRQLVLLCHLQSSSKYALSLLARRIARSSQRLSGNCHELTPYDPWAPREDSPLRRAAMREHQRLFGFTPRLKVVHAGLECGSFARHQPTLDMISFGPAIYGAHTPDERVSISSVDNFRRLLLAIVASPNP